MLERLIVLAQSLVRKQSVELITFHTMANAHIWHFALMA
jgi:hypothetical protein